MLRIESQLFQPKRPNQSNLIKAKLFQLWFIGLGGPLLGVVSIAILCPLASYLMGKNAEFYVSKEWHEIP